jgi:hypothetical protein
MEGFNMNDPEMMKKMNDPEMMKKMEEMMK